ncbi:hypothetical protein ELO03_29645, partial [Klebsiella pneumoniae]|nr:hypothetical protein [Klebsiella pneumoniae]
TPADHLPPRLVFTASCDYDLRQRPRVPASVEDSHRQRPRLPASVEDKHRAGSDTHHRAHETDTDLVWGLLREKKKGGGG